MRIKFQLHICRYSYLDILLCELILKEYLFALNVGKNGNSSVIPGVGQFRQGGNYFSENLLSSLKLFLSFRYMFPRSINSTSSLLSFRKIILPQCVDIKLFFHHWMCLNLYVKHSFQLLKSLLYNIMITTIQSIYTFTAAIKSNSKYFSSSGLRMRCRN